jgi:hypothetical protein
MESILTLRMFWFLSEMSCTFGVWPVLEEFHISWHLCLPMSELLFFCFWSRIKFLNLLVRDFCTKFECAVWVCL